MKKTLVTNRTRMPKSSRNNSKRPILFRRLSIFLLICMVAISSFSVSADSLLYESPASNYPAINAIVNKYATSDTVFTVSGHKALKSLSTDEADYTLYSLYPYGFAIFLNETNSMMEACYQENVTLPVSMDSTVAYYGGPMNYYEIVDEKFSAQMEKNLDNVEAGKQNWKELLSDFYGGFKQELADAETAMEGVRLKVPDEETDEVCELCGRNMVVKVGRFGKFLACPGFPECSNAKPLLEKIDVTCPICGKGDVVLRRSKKGRTFYGCSDYPECSFVSWDRPTGEKCPKCPDQGIKVLKR